MKKLKIRTDKNISENNSFEVAIDDGYYDILEEEFQKITSSAGVVETKGLISSLISNVIKMKQLEKEVDSLYKRLS